MNTHWSAFLIAISLANPAFSDSVTVTVDDPVSGVRTITCAREQGYAIAEGDIIISTLRGLAPQSAVIVPKVGGSRWPEGIMPFAMDEALPLRTKAAIYQAMTHWQDNTGVEFVEIHATNRDQYPDYVLFTPAEGTTCASHVGRKGGQQEIVLSPRCTTMNTVHEIGHALGMWHEQSRADRASFIRIVWENIEEEHRHNFEQHLTDGKDFGRYDYGSIMHYGSYAFTKNGEKTIIPLQDGAEIGQRKQLSERDIEAINSMYPH